MIEVIVLGFATVLLVLPSLIAVARFVDATAAAESEARDAATWMAMHGTELSRKGSGIDVTTRVEHGAVRATARMRVTLVSIGGLTLEREAVASYEVPISPYRSRR